MSTLPPLRPAWALLSTAAVLSGCPSDLAERPPRPHRSVGSEVFRVVCMNLAAQAFPNDLTGERFSAGCDGAAAIDDDADEVPAPAGESELRAYQRHRALTARRERLVQALDATFDSDAYRPDELRDFLTKMVPLYDPPEELPEVTRAAADLLTRLIDPNDEVGAEAISALARMSVRDGYRPARFGLALTRSLLAYPKLDEVLRTTLPAIAPDGPARGPFEDLLNASALDLATADRSEPDPKRPGSLTLATRLLFAEDDAFSGSTSPTFLTLRDARGVARPMAPGGAISAPFQDLDADGLADIDQRGRFVLTSGEAASPYPTFESAYVIRARSGATRSPAPPTRRASPSINRST